MVKCGCFICKHWEDLKTFMATINFKESTAAVKCREILCNSEVMRDVGYVAALGFLSDLIRISETQGYTAANADKNIEDLSEKLNVLSNTGNPAAGIALNKLFYILEKIRDSKLSSVKRRV